MSNKERGEHSRIPETSDGEKPFKKARYAWEVKGKHHLKESYRNNTTIIARNHTPEIVPVSGKHLGSCKDNQENVEKCIKNQNDRCGPSKCCLQSFLAKTEFVMDTDQEVDEKNIDTNISNEIPVTLVSPTAKNQDYYLRKWQARQIARGFVDNTINSVLETWLNPPFDAADFIENCTNDGQVEDDAILMAIQSHGLQSSAPEGSSVVDNTEDAALVRSPLIQSTLDNLENYQNELMKERADMSNSNSADSVRTSNRIEDGFIGEPFDFMSQAVSAAIQKKGLSYGY